MPNLKYLKNTDLDLRMKSLARQERELLAVVLETIREIDNRKLFAEFGFPNLFSYLVDGVGYSAASAQRRIDGARLLGEIPEVSSKIESGEIKLTQVSVLQKAVREIKRTRGVKIAANEKLELLESLSGKTHHETEKQVAQFFDLPIVNGSKERVQADESVRLELTLKKEQSEKLKLAQALISHAVPTNDVAAFLEYVCEKIINQKTVVRNENTKTAKVAQATKAATAEGAGEKPDASNSFTLEVNTSLSKENQQKTNVQQVNILKQNKIQPQNKNPSQNFSARTKKLTIEKLKTCQYRDPKSQKLCGSKWFLQVDHRQSKWAQGSSELENANLLCETHNHEKYRHEQQIRRV